MISYDAYVWLILCLATMAIWLYLLSRNINQLETKLDVMNRKMDDLSKSYKDYMATPK